MTIEYVSCLVRPLRPFLTGRSCSGDDMRILHNVPVGVRSGAWTRAQRSRR